MCSAASWPVVALESTGVYASLALADAYRVLVEGVLALGDRPPATALLAQAQAIHAAHPAIGAHYTDPLRALAARLTSLP